MFLTYHIHIHPVQDSFHNFVMVTFNYGSTIRTLLILSSCCVGRRLIPADFILQYLKDKVYDIDEHLTKSDRGTATAICSLIQVCMHSLFCCFGFDKLFLL